jgi:HlyD family secretion protein
MLNRVLILLSLPIVFFSCKEEKHISDASGSFEAIETIVSAEANGKIMQFSVNEGDTLSEGQLLGYLDSNQLHLNKLQLLQSRKTILSARPDVQVQLKSTQRELDEAMLDKARIENLVKGGVASQKQLDNINSKIAVLNSRLEAQQSTLRTTTVNIDEQGNNVYTQLSIVDDQLKKCRIVNPVKGTVLVKYAEPNEMASVGKPLYKIADLSSIILRAYVTGDQLPQIKLNQHVKVLTDDGKGGYHEGQGVINWISNAAEFTPKTVQTKNERANLVYAVKVMIPNDGRYKIGMYGEIKL